MTTSNEIKAQVAELMKRLAETEEVERRVAEEEEHWWHVEEEEAQKSKELEQRQAEEA